MRNDIWRGLGFRMESTPGDPPAALAPDPVAPPPAEPPAPGPWAEQLASTFADEAERTRVDEFLRGAVQPYVTQLEQSRNPDAQELYKQLTNNPGETYLAITEELWGADAAEKVRQSLLALEDPPEDPPVTEPETPPAAPPAPLDPTLARIKEKYEADEKQAAYNEALAKFKTDNNITDIKDARFAPFVFAADGDLAAAYVGYKEWLDDYRNELIPPTDPPPAADPPPVIGSDTTAHTAPPTVKQGQSIDDAIDDFLNENRAVPPPPVGTT